MKKAERILRVIAGLLTVAIFAGILLFAMPTQVMAKKASSTEIKNEIAKLEKEQKVLDEQLAELEAQLDKNKDDLQSVVKQKDVLDQEVTVINFQIMNLNQRIAAYTLLIAEKQEEVEKAQQELEDMRKKYKARIRAMEEGGTVSYWAVLFESTSFSDLLDRINMIREIAAADTKRLDNMNDAVQAVEEAKAAMEQEKTTLDNARKEMDGVKVLLAQKQEEANAVLSKLVATGEEYRQLVEDAEEEAMRLVEEMMAKEKDLDAAEKREYEEWLAQQNPPVGTVNTVDGVGWLVPVKYGRVSSKFGYRTHPVTGEKGTFHKGIDLTASTGTPVYAARSGVANVYSTETGGNTVSLNHQDGYKTNYLHLDSYVVKKGDWVAAGQLIGYVGSTGRSTGPHLHYAVYKNGEAVDPAKYLGIK